jgi:hypothetical protein
VKKLLVGVAVAAGVAIAVRRSRAGKADAELWREATAPRSP